MSFIVNSATASCQAFLTAVHQHPCLGRISRAGQVAFRAMQEAHCSQGLIVGFGLMGSAILLNPVISSERSFQVMDGIGLACITVAVAWLSDACDRPNRAVDPQEQLPRDADLCPSAPSAQVAPAQLSDFNPVHSPEFLAASMKFYDANERGNEIQDRYWAIIRDRNSSEHERNTARLAVQEAKEHAFRLCQEALRVS